jgi:hypothetical protein
MTDSVTLGGLIITLVNGYPQCINGEQTWRYYVKFDGDPPEDGISNFAFALCRPQHNVVDFSPEEGAEYDENNAQPCLRNQFGTRRQIKWNNITIAGYYEFVLDGCFKSCNINVAVHNAGTCYYGEITGPCCELLNGDGGRGIDFSNLKDTTIEY